MKMKIQALYLTGAALLIGAAGVGDSVTFDTVGSWTGAVILAVLLAAAGINYIMGIPMGDDAMLSYQTTSYHDAPALRQALGLRPLPEFESWMEEVGLWKDGQLTDIAGDASFFLKR